MNIINSTINIINITITRYLLGLTITTGAVVSLPFLYYSDTVVKKVGGRIVNGLQQSKCSSLLIVLF